MAEPTDNVVLRLLREIRAEQTVIKRTVETTNGRLTTLERKMDDVNESVTYALGLSAHANVAYETTGQRIDRLTDAVKKLEARVTELEAQE
jgi:chaperonin cofactor prefoldin